MDENLFRGKYRIPSARLKNWDYRSSAPYFVTICTHKMQHFFGHIENKKMILNDLGLFVRQSIDNLEIYCKIDTDDKMIIDPESSSPSDSTDAPSSLAESTSHAESTDAPRGASLRSAQSGNPSKSENPSHANSQSYISIINQIIMPNHLHLLLELKNHTTDHLPNKFGPLLKKSLSSIINHFKGRITTHAKLYGIPKLWHPRFHDHIVRDMIEYGRIFDYITNNPSNWGGDKFNQPEK
jgi:putative transposase